MDTLEQNSGGQPLRRLAVLAAALVAASTLVASAAPASAFGLSAMPQAAAHDGRSAFHRHFYRGVPYSETNATGADLVDARMMAADAEEMDSAIAYCASRFKSYDPSTGSYLGYDGLKHACP